MSSFGPFRELFVCPPFCENLILTTAKSKLKIISLATRELLVCPLWGLIFDPQKWTTRKRAHRWTKNMNFHQFECHFSNITCLLVVVLLLFFIVVHFSVFMFALLLLKTKNQENKKQRKER